MDFTACRIGFTAGVCILVGGCAAAPPPAAPAERVVPLHTGVLVALRPVGAWRGAVLSALGTPGDAGLPALVECIVRDDDGGTLSVVQPQAEGLRAGLRVAVLAGSTLRVAPAEP
jgi:hypothetical protein